MESERVDSKSLEFITVSDCGVKLYCDPKKPTLLKTWEDGDDAYLSDNGTFMCILPRDHVDQVQIIDLSKSDRPTTQVIQCTSSVKKALFSPLGTYLITLQKWNDESQEPNITIWRLSDQRPVLKIACKNTSNFGAWPPVHWSDDEKVMTRKVTDSAQIYLGDDWDNPIIRKIPCPNIALVKPNPDGKYLAIFTKKTNALPAKCIIYDINNNLRSPSYSKSLPNCDEVTFHWSYHLPALLIETETDVDKSNKSYFGTTSLFFVTVDGSVDRAVVVGNSGPLHDVVWNPRTDEFAVIAGDMPPSLTLYEGKTCTKTIIFGNAARNTIKYSPDGTMMLSGGFGNLPGELDIWFLGKTKPVGTTRSHCTVDIEWFGDSRYFYCAATSPRRRTDNYLSFYYYDGVLMSRLEAFDKENKITPGSEFVISKGDGEGEEGRGEMREGRECHFKSELYYVRVRNVTGKRRGFGVVGRALTPLKERESFGMRRVEEKTEKKVGAYRPPNASGNEFANRLKEEKDGNACARAVRISHGGPGEARPQGKGRHQPPPPDRVIPGMAPAPKKKNHNQRKPQW